MSRKSKSIIPSNEALGLIEPSDQSDIAFFSWIVADRNNNRLPKRAACMVLKDFMNFAEQASLPENRSSNSKRIQKAFSRIGRFCEKTPEAQKYIRRGFTESDAQTETMAQLAIPVVTADELFQKILLGKLGDIKAKNGNNLALSGIRKKSIQLAYAASLAVQHQFPELLNTELGDDLPPAGGWVLLSAENPDSPIN
jgi:hypothetical protein